MAENSLGISFNRVDFLKKALDGSWKKNEAILNNIANVNTPNYKRQDIDFQSVLKAEISRDSGIDMKTTNMKHIENQNSSIDFKNVREESFSARQDENNVNIDTEVAKLTENAIMYDILTNEMTGAFKKWKMIIEEGGR